MLQQTTTVDPTLKGRTCRVYGKGIGVITDILFGFDVSTGVKETTIKVIVLLDNQRVVSADLNQLEEVE